MELGLPKNSQCKTLSRKTSVSSMNSTYSSYSKASMAESYSTQGSMTGLWTKEKRLDYKFRQEYWEGMVFELKKIDDWCIYFNDWMDWKWINYQNALVSVDSLLWDGLVCMRLDKNKNTFPSWQNSEPSWSACEHCKICILLSEWEYTRIGWELQGWRLTVQWDLRRISTKRRMCWLLWWEGNSCFPYRNSGRGRKGWRSEILSPYILLWKIKRGVNSYLHFIK